MAEKILLADGETVLLDTLADALTSEGTRPFAPTMVSRR